MANELFVNIIGGAIVGLLIVIVGMLSELNKNLRRMGVGDRS